jgi:hypothetical protein
MSLDKRKRIGYASSLREAGVYGLKARQHPRQDSGVRIQEQLWERASRHEKHREVAAFAQTKGRVLCEREKKDSSKVNDRSGDVSENKGPAFSSRARSGNVLEKKVVTR